MGDKCGGAIQFGDPIDKRKLIGLVQDTGWRDFLELNRLAFADWLPRNGESRCLGFAMRWLKKTYPWLKWIVSFADATRCGDGAIYRASGFVLTGIKKNKTMWRLKNGDVIADLITRQKWNVSTKARLGFRIGESWRSFSERVGAELLPGFQLRYIYFLDRDCRDKLTVPIIPFGDIERAGASMYKGEKITRGESDTDDTPGVHPGEGGSTPTSPLHLK
jgi:hypothetical protein